MKKTSVLMAIIAMTLSTMPMAIASGHAEITSPTAGEVIYQNTLNLEASDPNVAVDGTAVHWAVVTDQPGGPECTGDIHANRNSHQYTWENGEFSAEVDLSGLAAGEYCFVFNTLLENSAGERLVHWFYIVDDYAKVGGVVDTGGDAKGNGTHSMEGVVGDAGTAGIVGSIAVNYRNLSETVIYEAVSIGLEPASGVTGHSDIAKAVIYTADGTQIQVLDSDATDAFPRGAVIVRPNPDSGYRIGGLSGAGSWVAMLKGNNHVGTR